MSEFIGMRTQPSLYVYFPLPLAAAIGLNAGDQVQWELLNRGELHLVRMEVPPPVAKEKSVTKKELK